MSKKSPDAHHLLPDRQLARAFNFDSEDLAANRLGFLTDRQKWQTVPIIGSLIEFVTTLLPARQRDPVAHVCGRISINYKQLNHKVGRYPMAHVLTVSGGYSLEFTLTGAQYNALVYNVGRDHHIYYIFRGNATSRIVAIELADGDC